MIRQTSPSTIEIPKESLSAIQFDQLKAALTYTDQKAVFELAKLKRNAGWYTEEVFEEKKNELKAKTKVCLLFEKENSYWTYSGLIRTVQRVLNIDSDFPKDFTYPEPKLIPWNEKPVYEMYPYQAKALEKLLEARHGGVQIGTGLGKSFIIANLTKSLGLKTLIMAPSASIAEQLVKDFTVWFGKKYVGSYFDGKKEPKKQIVIGTAQSFTRVEKDSDHGKLLSKTEVFIADESHQCPARTLASVCFGLVANAPYRFFFSATQVRNDGSELLLNAITGPIVFEMTVREGVDGKYLAKPIFHMTSVPPNGDFRSPDANLMTRKHLFYNPAVTAHIGKLCNMAVAAGMPVLVLIEEVQQFTDLLPYLRHQVGFAHGPLAENKSKVPPDFHDSDPNALVKEFNEGRLPILVGTSCISTGTDVKAVRFLIYWQGGKSEIQVKQAIGRGTRLAPNKSTCHVIDFWVRDPSIRDPSGGLVTTKNWVLGKHASERIEIYNDLYGPVLEDEI